MLRSSEAASQGIPEQNTPLRIFIGSGEASLLERKVLIFSLRQHTQRPLDIRVFNGTHNAIERDGAPPVLAPLSLPLKYRQKTEFSLYRYLIPELCGHHGRALYLDSDIICRTDIGELFDTSLDGYDFLARPASYGPGHWGPSVMLIDCGRTRFDLKQIFDEIDSGSYTYLDFSRFAPKFRGYHAYRIGALAPYWNDFDRCGPETRIVHYTDLLTQPWKFQGHPFGDMWFQYFRAALDAGVISAGDVRLSIERGYVRPDILEGNRPRNRYFKRLVKRLPFIVDGARRAD